MTFFFLNQDETIIGTLNESEVCRVDECNFTAEFSFMESSDFSMDDAVYVGFEDIDGNLVFYEIGILKRDSSMPGLVNFDAEHAAMSELLQQVVEGKAVTGAMAGFAATRVLEGSRWTVSSSENTPQMSTTFYFQNRWDCLETISRMTGAAFYFAWTISGNAVTGRNVIVKARAGSSRGKRFDLSKDMSNIHVDTDRTQLYTRLYGRGKGEEVGTDSEGDATYGRRIDFGEVVWSTSQGDPINKPANQLYLEDPAATAMFGRGPTGAKLPREGIVVFPDCEDPDELIELTWEKYQTVRYPILTITAKVYDLERIWGYTHEAIRRGDDVLVIADEWNATYSDRIVGLIRDYNAPENTEVTIGDEGKSIVSLTASLTSTIAKVKEQAELGANMAAANPSMLQGIIDTMATIIMSTGTNMTTDPDDGSLVFTASDGNSAVKITGNGILISNQRTGGAWVWKTAINGNGIATGELTAGTINATLIKILGTDQFYWDASNIFIINPSNSNQQIRIGKYDGTHYGIAYTTNGGTSWQNAIDFSGVHFSASEVVDAVLDSTEYQQAMAAKADASDLSSLEAVAITEVKPQYYLSTSATSLSGDTWHDEPPTWVNGKYMWSRNFLTYADGDTDVTTAVCIAGAKGQDGTDGEDGRSVVDVKLQYYKSISASTTSGGSWSYDAPTWESGKYIWTRQLVFYSDDPTTGVASTPICTTGASGSNGTNGTNGTNGVSSYTYIRYSHYSDGTSMTEFPANDTLYIGLAVSSDSTAPSLASAYTWSRYVGADGQNGTNGNDGTSYYTYIRYSVNSSGNPMTTTPGANTKYIGIVTTTLSTAPTSYGSYTWSKYVGDDGRDGTDGTSVTILGSYNSLADLEAAHQTGSAGDAYIIDGDLYVWDPTGGQSGTGAWTDVGQIQGPAGEDGTSHYMFIRYSANADGSNMTAAPQSDTLYIGVCTTTASTAPSTAGSYTWSRYVGEDGQAGQSAYMYVRYSVNSNGNPMTTVPGTGTKYIGICSTTSSTAPSSYSSYTWSRYVGENGNSVSAVIPYYAKGTSSSTAPSTPSTTTWSVVAPAIGYGEYLWCAYLIRMTNGDSFTEPFFLNGADQLIQASSAPSSPVTGMLWLDTSAVPYELKRYNGTTWDVISDYSGQITSIYSYIDQTKTDIEETQRSIRAYVENETVAQSVYATFAQTVRNILEMDASGTTMLFQHIQDEIQSVDDRQQANHAEILQYIRFENGNIILGEEGNETTLKLENDILGFYQSGTLVAYFRDNKLYVQDIQALSSFKIGNYEFTAGEQIGLMLKYIGT